MRCSPADLISTGSREYTHITFVIVFGVAFGLIVVYLIFKAVRAGPRLLSKEQLDRAVTLLR